MDEPLEYNNPPKIWLKAAVAKLKSNFVWYYLILTERG